MTLKCDDSRDGLACSGQVPSLLALASVGIKKQHDLQLNQIVFNVLTFPPTSFDDICPLGDGMNGGLSHALGPPEVADPVLRHRDADCNVLTRVVGWVSLPCASCKQGEEQNFYNPYHFN